MLLAAWIFSVGATSLSPFILYPSHPPAVPDPVSSSATLNSTGNFQVDCAGDVYGKGLTPDSCAEALERIPTSDNPLKFGLRGRQGVDVVTPWRWISSDGTCAIEVAETSGAQGNYLDLVTAAHEMTDLCMDFMDPTEGSVARNIGVDGNLSLTMRVYKPTVSCRRSINLGGSSFINEILRKMPAVSTRTVFGRRGVPGVRVLLPLTFTSIHQYLSSRLVATVDLTSANVETASWYDIWAATVAISGMCVNKGKGGSSSFLGKKHIDCKHNGWLIPEI
ncbi:MAG: hypothetical protein LQ346_007001 [Caloplaca aetnensis]|nr:MAG: hypothetical protein LQ346_007001 [Caloplaca aetnensis]